MAAGDFRFDIYRLDLADRRLSRDGVPVELNARYLDALALLVREGGRLVTKDRFMDEVWRGVPVTDEALTQCIKTLRRQLGDDAARPRFIETVPKHGYRFVAVVEDGAESSPPVEHVREAPPASDFDWPRALLYAAAGVIGAGLAGLIGGIFYGFAGASQPLQPGMGAISVLLVLMCLTILTAVVGGTGVALGLAASGFAARPARAMTILGGAMGGLIVGAIVKLLGVDAFNLLFGQSPGNITGGPEGLLLGGAVGLGAWLGGRGRDAPPLRRSMIATGVTTGLAGLTIPLLGGRLMGGSLDLLARQFAQSRLRLDQIGAMLGESGFGPVSQLVTGALEGALFGSCLVGAMIVARRSFRS